MVALLSRALHSQCSDCVGRCCAAHSSTCCRCMRCKLVCVRVCHVSSVMVEGGGRGQGRCAGAGVNITGIGWRRSMCCLPIGLQCVPDMRTVDCSMCAVTCVLWASHFGQMGFLRCMDLEHTAVGVAVWVQSCCTGLPVLGVASTVESTTCYSREAFAVHPCCGQQKKCLWPLYIHRSSVPRMQTTARSIGMTVCIIISRAVQAGRQEFSHCCL